MAVNEGIVVASFEDELEGVDCCADYQPEIHSCTGEVAATVDAVVLIAIASFFSILFFVQYQVLFTSLVSFFWTIYLALLRR